MKQLIRLGLALLALLGATTASATFHTYVVEQVYSNADGSVQFIVLYEAEGANGQHEFATHKIGTTGPAGTKSYTFPKNLPSPATANTRVLVATQGFADLGLVAPDYIVPNGFVPIPSGRVSFVALSILSYDALPNDGVSALYGTGEVKRNLATNFAGQSASVALGGPPVTPPATPAANYQGLWWNPGESGWGINFAHQGDILFASWFTYDSAGKPWWLIAVLNKSAAGIYQGEVATLVGPPFGAPGWDAARVKETTVGTMTASFSDATHGTLSYTVNGVAGTKAIVPQSFGPLPVCAWESMADLALATNYTDLWWNAAESGWGINFTHQGDVVFATWFTYDAAGKPWWLIAVLQKTALGTYTGPVSTLVGPAFGSSPFDPGKVVETVVGTATVTFGNGNSATLVATVDGMQLTKVIARQVFEGKGTACR